MTRQDEFVFDETIAPENIYTYYTELYNKCTSGDKFGIRIVFERFIADKYKNASPETRKLVEEQLKKCGCWMHRWNGEV
jgi:hypothetical protein